MTIRTGKGGRYRYYALLTAPAVTAIGPGKSAQFV